MKYMKLKNGKKKLNKKDLKYKIYIDNRYRYI